MGGDWSADDRQLRLGAGVSRRTVLKTAGVGALSAISAPILAACTGKSSGSPSVTASKSPTSFRMPSATFGSSASDPVPKKAIADTIIAFEIKSGAQVSVTTFEHNDLQDHIGSYLTGNPDDAFMWFAGYRMRFGRRPQLALRSHRAQTRW